MEKDKKTGAVRKTEEGAKAPDSSDKAPVVGTDEVPGGASVPSEADKKAADDKVVADKAKKAANDKASKIKREKEEAAKKVVEAEAAKRRGAYIKPGLAITSNKGIVAGAPKGDEAWEGDKVTSKHFSEDTYKRLVKNGDIVIVK